uniref:ATP synthase F0 subunit 8 n=2 Tax=Bemisia tabaci TaxID=7038 RepID=A0A343KPD4_BEMTA|nr:ATP synthase F0 subunit 8 [Bemisia tabaci]
MPQMGPLWWFNLMLMFWLSWFMVSLSFFYWFSLSSLMVLNSPLSFFFFFFYYNKNEFLFTSMNNKISLANMMFFYFYDL